MANQTEGKGAPRTSLFVVACERNDIKCCFYVCARIGTSCDTEDSSHHGAVDVAQAQQQRRDGRKKVLAATTLTLAATSPGVTPAHARARARPARTKTRAPPLAARHPHAPPAAVALRHGSAHPDAPRNEQDANHGSSTTPTFRKQLQWLFANMRPV